MNSETEIKRELDDLADESGLAIITVDENSDVLSESNDNSMCRFLYGSAEFSPSCAEFCGRAYEWANEAEKAVEYKCYAGLNCMAVQMKNKKSVAIIGRVFLKSEDYRSATTRAESGDWQQFPADEFFGNALFGTAEDLEKTTQTVAAMEEDEALEIPVAEISASEAESHDEIPFSEPEFQEEIPDTVDEAEFQNETSDAPDEAEFQNEHSDVQDFEIESSPVEGTELTGEEPGETITTETNPQSAIRNPQFRQWRSLFGSFLKSDYEKACRLIADFVAQIYAIENLAWLERDNGWLEKTFAKGELDDDELRLSISAGDKYLLDAIRTRTPLELREKQDAEDAGEARVVWLFPFIVDGEAQSALIVGGELEESKKRQITRFCQKIAPQLEILRLREKLSKSHSIERAIEKFNENLKMIDAEDFWTQLMNASAELMRAERTSLLIFDEESENFTAKAATGVRAEFVKSERGNLGRRVAKNVLNEGKAVVVKDVNKIGLQNAPKEWLYKTDSFISYPIEIAGRKIGVLNLTDKADGKNYDAADLKLLDSVMPSLAVMIDRAELKTQAGAFKQLSVTDALTGLRNRRYLEERLTEEIKRSNRHGFPMSFLMIDVDEFKSYNDNFGHTEGDKALQMVGACLKETLRGADVAARYGGEEFSILLPQTNSAEAEVIAERVRERVENECFPNRQVTISVGIASCSLSLNSTRDLIAAADKALYEAKNSGRNNVQVYEALNSSFTARKRRTEK